MTMSRQEIKEFEKQFSADYKPCDDCLSGNCDDCFEWFEYITSDKAITLPVPLDKGCLFLEID